MFIILDCCCASAAAASFVSTGFRQGGRTEILAGCGFDGRTNGIGTYSTTGALTKELNTRARADSTFSVVQLHQQLLAKMTHQHPANNPDSCEEDLYIRFPTPVYISLCSDYTQPSIPLKKLPLQLPDSSSPEKDMVENSTKTSDDWNSQCINASETSISPPHSSSWDESDPIVNTGSTTPLDYNGWGWGSANGDWNDDAMKDIQGSHQSRVSETSVPLCNEVLSNEERVAVDKLLEGLVI